MKTFLMEPYVYDQVTTYFFKIIINKASDLLKTGGMFLHLYRCLWQVEILNRNRMSPVVEEDAAVLLK